MKIKNMIKYLPAFVFLGFIFAFMILYIVLPKESFSAQEKKQLSEFPEVTAEAVMNGEFQEKLDTYLSDHVPFRNTFVGLSANYELISGRNGKKGIYLGNDGYLFPKPTKDGELLHKNAGFIKEYADCSDIPVYMTVIPSSGYINNDKLPLIIYIDYNIPLVACNLISGLRSSSCAIQIRMMIYISFRSLVLDSVCVTFFNVSRIGCMNLSAIHIVIVDRYF